METSSYDTQYFPAPILLRISKYLDVRSLYSSAGVSKHWRRVLLSARVLRHHLKRILTSEEMAIMSFLNNDGAALSNYFLVANIDNAITHDPLSFPFPSAVPWLSREWPARMANCCSCVRLREILNLLLCFASVRLHDLMGIHLNILNISSSLARDLVPLSDLIHFVSIFIRGLSLAVSRSTLHPISLLSVSFEPRSTMQLWIVEPILNTLHIGKDCLSDAERVRSMLQRATRCCFSWNHVFSPDSALIFSNSHKKSSKEQLGESSDTNYFLSSQSNAKHSFSNLRKEDFLLQNEHILNIPANNACDDLTLSTEPQLNSQTHSSPDSQELTMAMTFQNNKKPELDHTNFVFCRDVCDVEKRSTKHLGLVGIIREDDLTDCEHSALIARLILSREDEYKGKLKGITLIPSKHFQFDEPSGYLHLPIDIIFE